MYNIYTSYFDNKKLKGKHNDMFLIPVCNRVYVWDGYSEHYSELAPDMREVEKLHEAMIVTERMKRDFTQKYIEKLDFLRKEKVLDRYVDDLELRKSFQDVVLLCYEKPKEFCHRHILAKYLNECYNLDIQEY